jgi:peroxiredoxin
VTLETGRPAPDFALKSQHGEDITLASYRSRRAVVVMFYPFAFSSICTGELAEVRDHLPEFDNDDVALLAVSCDPMFAVRAFADAEGFTFPLLSDFWPHGEVARRYGVFDAERGCALRGTFVLDASGILRWKVENGLPDARELEAVKRALTQLSA